MASLAAWLLTSDLHDHERIDFPQVTKCGVICKGSHRNLIHSTVEILSFVVISALVLNKQSRLHLLVHS